MKPLHFFFILSLSGFIVSPVNAQDHKQDDKAIHHIVATMESGWNTKSGAQFATHFAPNHDYIVWSGVYLPNISTEVNAMAHQGIFNAIYKNIDLELRIDKIRYVRDDIAIAHVLGATYDHGAIIPALPAIIITMVLEKKNNAWEIVSFHNCDIETGFSPADPNSTLPPPQVMFASWTRAEQ